MGRWQGLCFLELWRQRVLGIEVDRSEEEGEYGQSWAGQEASGWSSSWSSPLLLRVGFLLSMQFGVLKGNEP